MNKASIVIVILSIMVVTMTAVDGIASLPGITKENHTWIGFTIGMLYIAALWVVVEIARHYRE